MSVTLAAATVIGAVVSSVGSIWAAKEERKAEERAKIAEEKRAEKRYEGIGEAASIKDPTQADEQLDREGRSAKRVGSKPDRVGDRYNRDEELTNRGLGRRPQIAKLLAPETGTSRSVAQGAAPQMSQFAMKDAGVPSTTAQPAGEAQSYQPRKPRYSYNPQSGRIETGDAAAPNQPAAPAGAPALPPRPTMQGK